VLPIASAGELEVKGLQLATPWAFARNKLRVSQPGGSVDLAAATTSRTRTARRRSAGRHPGSSLGLCA